MLLYHFEHFQIGFHLSGLQKAAFLQAAVIT